MIKKVSSKNKVETFIDTYARFNAYQGSLSQKNIYLVNLYYLIRDVMQDPAQFVTEIMKTNKYQRNLRKCMDILRDYHYYYSVESSPD